MLKRSRSPAPPDAAGFVPDLSVVLPVYNAMPWLPITMKHLLRQRLEGDRSIEIVAAVDGSSDNSLPFLLEVVSLLGSNLARSERCEPPLMPGVRHATNPALVQQLRAPETEDHYSFREGHVATSRADTLGVEKSVFRDPGNGDACGTTAPTSAPPDAAEVAASCRNEHRLLVLHYDGNCGQGAAMSLALSRCRAPLIAQMESDDERANEHAFAHMVAELRAHADWDGVSCNVETCGDTGRDRMGAYVAWQNSLGDPSAMAAERFIEIPALHQSAIYKREVIDDLLAPTLGRYRDGPWCASGSQAGGSERSEEGSSAAEAAHANSLDTPVDLWWWLEFFHAGKRCGKVSGSPLLGWRQHPRQHTRTHGRLSIENLRKIKVHFLLRRGGPLDGARRVILLSVGATLSGFEADLRAHPAIAGKEVVPVEWKPPKNGKGTGACTLPKHVLRRTVGLEEDHIVRLWAFGSSVVRQRIRDHVPDWKQGQDWFVA